MKKKIIEKIYSIAAIVIIIDQVIKILVTTKMSLNSSIEVIPNFFSIFYTKNTGAAFSILQDSSLILVIVSILFIYILNRFINTDHNFNKYKVLSYGLLIGGIIGNLIDRLLYHYVIDYLSFQFGNYFFPVFNIADSAITIGVVLMIIGMIKEDKKYKNIREKLSNNVEIIKEEEKDKKDIKKVNKKTKSKKTSPKKNNKKKK